MVYGVFALTGASIAIIAIVSITASMLAWLIDEYLDSQLFALVFWLLGLVLAMIVTASLWTDVTSAEWLEGFIFPALPGLAMLIPSIVVFDQIK